MSTITGTHILKRSSMRSTMPKVARAATPGQEAGDEEEAVSGWVPGAGMSRAHPLRRIWLALLLLVAGCALLSRAAAFPDWTDCPAVCSCRWTHGKKSALCPGAGLTSLPTGLDPEMQVLDLSGNRIPDLQAEIFKDFGLVNLQRVFLRSSGIRSVHAESFKDMRILVEVDLSDNHLTSLDPRTFTGNERLKQLVLSGNPLGILRANQFPRLQHLRNLELQRCQLAQVHHLAFQWLTNLETLSLDNNKLEYLDGEAVVRLRQLKTLSLDNNPWSCDCRLRDFRQLLMPAGEMHGLYSVPQICHSPARNQGRRWEELAVSEFACEPTVYLPVSNIQEEMNGNVSLACLASGDPEPEVWWWLNGGPINGSRRPPDEVGPPGSVVVYSTSLETRRRLVQRWNNLTIYNASDAYAGEYTCHARNVAGMVRDTVAVSIPQVFTAPTLSQADNWLLWLSLAGGGAVALSVSASAVLLAVCLCGGARRRSRRAKVKLQASASFGDQEKKLLDLSVTTTATTTSQQHHPNQHHNHNQPSTPAGPLHCDPNHRQPDFELELEPCLIQERLVSSGCLPGAASVTVEQLRLGPRDTPRQLVQLPPSQAPVLCPVAVAPGGGGRCLSPALPPNIFIAVSLPSGQGSPVAGGGRCYPDLLDVGMSSFATLPRRAAVRGSRELGSPYDNMGPRVTATGSSTFSLAEQPDALSLAAAAVPLIQPPPEFVSL